MGLFAPRSNMSMSERLRVLIVDDSALMRYVLHRMLASEPGIEVVAEASNGNEALQKVALLHPDVITMDVRMPVMDGLETTEQLMAYYPTPILVVTASISRYDIDITFKMLGAGALDIMEKPRLDDPQAYESARRDLIRRIKLLARVKVVTHLRGRRRAESRIDALRLPEQAAQPVHNLPARPKVINQSSAAPTFPLVVIGASTGGPRAIRQILMGLPPSFGAAILVVQHIAQGFSVGMVDWLSSTCTLPMKLASEGDSLRVGTVLVAPDCYDVLVQKNGLVHLSSEPLLLQHPSIDITMQAAAEVFNVLTIGVLLTGMGRDGAIGMQSIRRAGGYTIAQDEASCTIFGMPRAAIELGCVCAVLPLEGIITALQQQVTTIPGRFSINR